jgi:cell division transport system permease protein
MAQKQSYLRSRTRSTFLTSLFVIALVLFFLALFAGTGIYTRLVLEHAQENFEVMVTLPEHSSEDKVKRLEAYLSGQPYVKSLHFVSKEQAGEIFKDQVGEEFLEIMDGVNPLPASFNFSLNLAWVNNDSLQKIHDALNSQEIMRIQDITYPIEEIEQLGKNIRTLGRFSIGIAALVALIAFFIVNSTIRLAIYGKRLLIRSMELIGATSGFIRGPFLRMGLLQGFLGGVIGVAAVAVLLLVFGKMDLSGSTQTQNGLPLGTLLYAQDFIILCGGIIIFGALLGLLSSWWAVSRFLNKSLNELM